MSDHQRPVPLHSATTQLGDWVLAAGDASDAHALSRWLEQLPGDTFGRVFLEVFSPIQVFPLPTPARVGVTWLFREQRSPSPRPGIGAPRGTALVTAVDAWLDEWLRVEGIDLGGYHIWLGARTSPVVNDFWAHLSAELKGRSCSEGPGST